MRRFAWSLAFLVGCYRPGDTPQCLLACANDTECPDGFSCSNNRCASGGGTCGGDGGLVDAPGDGMFCFGTGVAQFCLPAIVVGPIPIDGALDTDEDERCQDVPQTGGSPMCVIAAESIAIEGVVRAEGSRPLVLAATGSITIGPAGTLDASSKRNARTGPGAFACERANGASGVDPDNATIGAGGAGGSFNGFGGTGGGAAGNMLGPTQPLPVTTFPTFVRGGCQGGDGGKGSGEVGPGGAGGGAVVLIASSIEIEGTVAATGAGAFMMPANIGSAQRGGGGGGGSGGMIGLDAPTVEVGVTARLIAHGGGGAGGGGAVTGGNAGSDPQINAAVVANIVATGGAGSGLGGNGGNGSGGATGMLRDGVGGIAGSVGAAGGGGGGGAGFIRFYCTACDVKPGALVLPPHDVVTPQ